MTPTKLVEQSAGYCGPASLSSLLDRYGVTKSEDELAIICRSNRTEGTHHDDIVVGLRSLSFEVMAKENGTLDELKRLTDLDTPVLVGWWSDNPPAGDHFSVVYDVDDAYVYLMDPEMGAYRQIEKQKFFESWYDFDTPENKLVRSWYMYVRTPPAK